jgi:hypothetical protein
MAGKLLFGLIGFPGLIRKLGPQLVVKPRQGHQGTMPPRANACDGQLSKHCDTLPAEHGSNWMRKGCL